jgi:hypothetical protein
MTPPAPFPKLYYKGSVMHMKAIQKRRNGYAVLFAVSICLTMWFAVRLMVETTFIFSVLSITLLILLIRQNRLLYDAKLIWENRILAMPSAVVSILESERRSDEEETVVSTFGILMGSKIYKWGSDGVHGVRLKAIGIDRARVYLTFGDGTETKRVELLHDITDEQTVMAMKQKLWDETGVMARICDW